MRRPMRGNSTVTGQRGHATGGKHGGKGAKEGVLRLTCCVAHKTTRPSSRLALAAPLAKNRSRYALVIGLGGAPLTGMLYLVVVMSKKLISRLTLLSAPIKRSSARYDVSECM